MKKNKILVFNALAFEEGYMPSCQIRNNNSSVDTYVKNAFISLKSMKEHNQQVEVALITNQELPQSYKTLFEKNNITVYIIDFNKFKLDKSFSWSLAYFKLDALYFAVNELPYDTYLLLDSDTITNSSLEYLWLELKNNILLFNTNYKSSEVTKQLTLINYEKIMNKNINIDHYGGEFIGGNKIQLQELTQYMKIFFDKMINCPNIDKKLGDEFILSCAANEVKNNIISGNGYIFRFWTGRYYEISTAYNKYPIFHLPGEKEDGLLWLYNYYIKNEKLPSKNKYIKKFGFKSNKVPFRKLIKLILIKYKILKY